MTTENQPLVLIADGNSNDVVAITRILSNEGYCFASANSVEELQNGIVQLRPAVVIYCRDNMGDVACSDVIKNALDNYPEIKFIVASEDADPAKVVICIKLGAFDYVTKPFQANQLITSIANAVKLQESETIRREMSGIPSSRADLPPEFDPYVGESLLTLGFLKKASIFAKRDFPILLQGENGIGKQLLAKLIHQASKHPGNFASISFRGLTETEAYTELYNALRRCNSGTLYIYDASYMTIHQQHMIVKALQERRFSFPYSMNLPEVNLENTRLIFGTSRPLEPLLQENKLDEKLYYSLSTNSVLMVPLRENRNDIPVLLDHFLRYFSNKMGKPVPTYPKELISLLKSYHFPGNISEFISMVENALAFHEKRMLSTSAFAHAMETRRAKAASALPSSMSFQDLIRLVEPMPSLKRAKEIYVTEALRRCENNQSATGKLLGITRQAINNYITRRASLQCELSEDNPSNRNTDDDND